jgi:radical SAM superfamily enzyme YgiQ (UPF0313 family)
MTERKSAKVALVNPPFIKGGYRHQLYLPIGLAYLAAVLERNGHSVSVIDCQALDIDYEALGAKLTPFEPDIVGITAVAPLINSAFQCARVTKKAFPSAQIVLGGPHATFMDEAILKEEAAVDIIVRGEGEQTLLELAQNQANSQSISKVDGITFRSDEQIIRTPNRAFIQNLEELPRPAYEHFSLEKYRLFGRTVLPVVTSRGCPFQCSFCVASRMFGKTYRMRSPKNVVDELEWLRNVHKAEAFTFYDDTLTFDKKRIYEICDGIKNRKIGLPWDCQSRVDQVSQEILAKMKEAGCQQIFFGVESGCQQVLDTVNKRTSIEQNEKAIKLAKDAGLFVTISVIIGYPGETRNTVNQTLNFIRRAKPDDAYICVATPYPGTELRNLVEKMGWRMSSDWNLYDTMTPVFENPELPSEEIRRIRREFYDGFYSPLYVFRQLLRKNSYSRMMARTAFNHLLWRIKSAPEVGEEDHDKN